MKPGTSTASLILSTRRDDDPPPRISVAVSTYQRAAMLPRLFDALTRQTLPTEDFEVVIVDNGSTHETVDIIRKLAPSSGLRLHVLRIEANRGPTPARNLAWREARAEIVAFTDDDCAPAPGWLEHGLRAATANNVVVVGRTLPDPDLPIGPFSRTIRVNDVNWLPTCNVFYRRSDLGAVGGFDESFLQVGGEDTDLAFRVRDECGREFAFAHDALVYHDVRPSRFVDAAKESFRWTGAPRFFRLHPDGRARLHRGIFWKPSHPKVILATIGLLLGLVYRPSLLLALPWLYYRTRVRRPAGPRRGIPAALPGTFVVDLFETIAMIRGSIRHRTPVL
jgi:glycosyltransferase involved in cell wall biosynthesis